MENGELRVENAELKMENSTSLSTTDATSIDLSRPQSTSTGNGDFSDITLYQVEIL